MKITQIQLCFLTIILASSLSAVRDEGFTCILSEDTRNQLVWEMVKESEDYARKQDFKRAAESLKHVINFASTNENISSELNEEITDGPLLLHIIGTRAQYLLKASKDTDYTVVTECTAALSNYSDQAEGSSFTIAGEAAHRIHHEIQSASENQRNSGYYRNRRRYGEKVSLSSHRKIASIIKTL